MAAILNRQLYNSLTSLEEAHSAIVANEAEIMKVINGPVRDLFLKHAVGHLFTLYLQHRHHTLSEGEAVVKVQGTAHVMDDETIAQVAQTGNSTMPTTWMIMDGQIHPMEFSVVEAASVGDGAEPSAKFGEELATLLADAGCANLFGVDSVAPQDWAEMSVGGASVVVPYNPGISASKADEDYISVSYIFDHREDKVRVHGKCKVDHKHTSKPLK
ncbi:hypothetical protein C8R46DRAFT_59590 [Mycena filopes]|nr:hypothetical protein C8R46DRAFT_59590 [Mycena filopes]